jgi:hypothetical protein
LVFISAHFSDLFHMFQSVCLGNYIFQSISFLLLNFKLSLS